MRKIALILAGGVSLGSFQAGVLTELLYTLERLGQRFTIDVICGASSGAMTAALVARAMFDDLARRRALRRAWVEQLDIGKMLEQTEERSVLSKAALLPVAREHCGEDFTGKAPAAFVPSTMFLSFTLANMNGIDYRIPDRLGGAGAVQTVFRDRIEFELDAERARKQETWTAIREAALASGNVPIAFTPAILQRLESEFPGHALSPFDGRFSYVDGGLFNNQPIGDAVALARRADGGEVSPDRVFILVDPGLNQSQRAAFDDQRTPVEVARRLGVMVYTQAAVNDWMRAQRHNAEIAWRDRLVDHLLDLVARRPGAGDADAVRAPLRETAAQIVTDKREVFPARYDDVDDYLDRAIARTDARLGAKLAGLPAADRALVAELVFVINSVAGLDNKSRVDLSLLTVGADEVAGEGLLGFAGFFKQEWRDFDYRVGRRLAHAKLPAILGLPAAMPQEPARAEEYVIPEAWKSFPKARIGQADRAPRLQVRERVVEQVGRAVEAYPIGPRWLRPIARPLMVFAARAFARKRMDQELEL